MKSYEQEMINVLKVLNDAGALEHVVVSGSWAMFFYKFIFEDFNPRVETTDLDFYLPSPKKASGDNITSRLLKCSYFRNNDYLTGKTMFLSSEGFSIEFLTIPDRTMSHTIDIKGMGVVAEALPKMAPAGWDYIQVKYEDLLVNVVSPMAFVLQKLLINNEREPEYKKEKDIDALSYVLSFIKASPKYSQLLKTSFDQYPKKWQKTIVNTAKKHQIDLGFAC